MAIKQSLCNSSKFVSKNIVMLDDISTRHQICMRELMLLCLLASAAAKRIIVLHIIL